MTQAIVFGSKHCGACRVQDPVLDQVAAELGIPVRHVDVEREPEVTAQYAVRSLPTLFVVDGNRVLGTQMGALPKPKLVAFFKRSLPSHA